MTPEEQTISEILSLSDDKAKIAMIQLLVKQRAIKFANWIIDSCYIKTSIDQWVDYAQNKSAITTEELYTQFIESQTIQ